MPTPRKEFTRCLKALANERRVRILQELLEGMPLDVDALARRLKLSYKSTAKHVAQLERCDFLQRVHYGNQVIYRVNVQHPIFRSVAQHLRGKD
jgi:DNA-binding transcriptional ArsR family regulator